MLFFFAYVHCNLSEVLLSSITYKVIVIRLCHIYIFVLITIAEKFALLAPIDAKLSTREHIGAVISCMTVVMLLLLKSRVQKYQMCSLFLFSLLTPSSSLIVLFPPKKEMMAPPTMDRYSRKPKPKKKYRDDYNDDDQQDDAGDADEHAPLQIAERHLVDLRSLGRPYRTDEEKQEVFIHLIRLKENRKTTAECADLLGLSPRTVANYIADPYYTELQMTLQQDAKQRGHLLISDVIDDAIYKLYGLMGSAKSEFVQYKSAEYLLKMAGYEIPQEARERDNQAEVIEFLAKLDARKPRVQVNVQIHGNGATTTETNIHGAENVVEASVIDATTDSTHYLPQNASSVPDDELAQYMRPMLPGGKMPKDEEE